MNREHEQAQRVLQMLAAELRIRERALRQRIAGHRGTAERDLPPLASSPRQ
jgi:hypothetical protein